MVSRTVAFRVDASPEIGTGHVMRCLTLADMLLKHKYEICFVCRHIPPNLQRLVEAKHQLIILPRGEDGAGSIQGLYSHWLAVPQEKDALDTISVLSHRLWTWIVVDHYAIDCVWESAVMKSSLFSRLLVIDDLNDRNHCCDVLLDQNLETHPSERYVDKVPKGCLRLLGPRYALLRPEFLLRRQTSENKSTVERLLVSFGGIDAKNHTGWALDLITEQLHFEGRVDVIVGANHPSLPEIIAKCESEGFFYHVETEHVASLMAAADLFLGAGGTSVWERCCVGLPGVVIATAANQEEQVEAGARAGIFLTPDDNEVADLGIKHQLSCLLNNAPLRALISANSMDLVDGLGAHRVCNILRGEEIVVRNATLSDERDIFEWRNSSKVRGFSGNSKKLKFEEHQKWFRSVCADDDKFILIGEISGVPIGVVRFEIIQDSAEVSIYLVPDQKLAVGMGGQLLEKCERWLFDKHTKHIDLSAEVLGMNQQSEKLFLSSGYMKYKTVFEKEAMSGKS